MLGLVLTMSAVAADPQAPLISVAILAISGLGLLHWGVAKIVDKDRTSRYN